MVSDSYVVFWSYFAPYTASTMPKNGAFIHLSGCLEFRAQL
jgi:hypothetical protein